MRSGRYSDHSVASRTQISGLSFGKASFIPELKLTKSNLHYSYKNVIFLQLISLKDYFVFFKHLIYVSFLILFRDLPMSILIGIPLVTVCYVLVNIAYLAVLTPAEIKVSSAVAVVSSLV